ncbi:MAG: ATP-binding protein [Gammaproteobacteria bacterium]|nr:ATP-binding protein [Gammaproteobacteria bacterium]MDE0251968.1 ATP-binding protein [Gammaproteobacteria bacterium]MDE0402924.1 ATP-binding protein [Gammaproteobacteria bacterium]
MYSPFSKPIGQLVTKDLSVLKNLLEGWSIEYKREMIKAEKIAKSVASFANTDGGWLFFGVEEPGKACESNKFPGIPKTKIHINKQQIAQAVSQHINPTPSFYIRVLDGPCNEINLKEDSSIIAVQVPYSNRTPHIQLHDGVIYQRTSDHSEPVPQTNRFQLDLLWQRGEEIRESVHQWVANDPEFTPNEKDIPYFRLLFLVDPWMPIPETWVKADRTEVKEILNGSSTDELRIKFDTVHTYQEGYLCRQFSCGQPVHYGLTFQVFQDLRCELNVPLDILEVDDFDNGLSIDGEGYVHKGYYCHILEEQNHKSSRIVNLNFVWANTVAAISKYLKFLKLAHIRPAFRFKAKLLNVSRAVPFIDSKVVIDYCETHGLPMVMHRDLEFPSGSGVHSFFQIEESEQHDITSRQGTRVFIQFLRSIGIEVTDRYEELLPDLNKILQRASDEQTLWRFLQEDNEDGDEDDDWAPPRL